jgi:hypothetical protein
MSQVASAFAVPMSALPEVQQHLSAGDWKGFWDRLRPFEIGTGYPHGGYVVVVMVEFLRELGIELPISSNPVVQELVECCDPLACTNHPGALAAAALAEVSVSDAELTAYWRDFTGEEDPQAGVVMRDALDWLRQAFAAAKESEWCIILEG